MGDDDSFAGACNGHDAGDSQQAVGHAHQTIVSKVVQVTFRRQRDGPVAARIIDHGKELGNLRTPVRNDEILNPCSQPIVRHCVPAVLSLQKTAVA